MRYLPRGMSIVDGRILVEGRDTVGLSDHELSRIRGNRIAMVYQDPMSSLNPVMPIGRQLMEVPLSTARPTRSRPLPAPSPCWARCSCQMPRR